MMAAAFATMGLGPRLARPSLKIDEQDVSNVYDTAPRPSVLFSDLVLDCQRFAKAL
jgi:hypothetical protein